MLIISRPAINDSSCICLVVRTHLPSSFIVIDSLMSRSQSPAHTVHSTTSTHTYCRHHERHDSQAEVHHSNSVTSICFCESLSCRFVDKRAHHNHRISRLFQCQTPSQRLKVLILNVFPPLSVSHLVPSRLVRLATLESSTDHSA